MLKEYDDLSNPPEGEDTQKIIDVPDFENEFVRAKTFLQTNSSSTGDNLYDHLTDVLNKILAERPENVIDFFEEYSRKVKEKRFKPLTDHLEDIFVHPPRYKLCKKLQPLLMPMGPEEPSTTDPEDLEIADMARNNMLQLLYYFEQVGIGLPRQEMFAIMLSMMRFVKQYPVVSVRFWGKIFGDYKNYLVLETELKEEELVRRHELEVAEREELARINEEAENQLNVEKQASELLEHEIRGEEPIKRDRWPKPPVPVVHFEEPPEVPVEPQGVGVNKMVYFVCNEIGDEWIELPNVTPQQIQVARQIRKSITGNLKQMIDTYPEFPGLEENYLRAQIARISAATQISPLGFYTFGEEGGEDMGDEEEDEEGGAKGGPAKTSFVENSKFDGILLRDMLEPSLAFWVHHNNYILKQGRTTWWNPYPQDELAGEEMGGEGLDEEDEKPKRAGAEPETGPGLLTPLSEDYSPDNIAPWSVRTSSNIVSKFAIVVIRSNIWPGAFCFASQGRLFENVYMGNGLKHLPYHFSPKHLPPVQQEYPTGPEIMEMEDATGAEEEAWRIAHLPPEKPVKEEGDDEEEEEEEEEDEDEDDDEED